MMQKSTTIFRVKSATFTTILRVKKCTFITICKKKFFWLCGRGRGMLERRVEESFRRRFQYRQ
jgi:hypothetical protein